MALKKNVKKVPVIEEPVPAPTPTPTQCGAWCFILGSLSGVFCNFETGHEGDHRVQINVNADPYAIFTIYWQTGEHLLQGQQA